MEQFNPGAEIAEDSEEVFSSSELAQLSNLPLLGAEPIDAGQQLPGNELTVTEQPAPDGEAAKAALDIEEKCAALVRSLGDEDVDSLVSELEASLANSSVASVKVEARDFTSAKHEPSSPDTVGSEAGPEVVSQAEQELRERCSDREFAVTPEQLQVRIRALRQAKPARTKTLSRAAAVALSLGVTVAGVMYGFFYIGSEIARVTGIDAFLPASLLIGAVCSFYLGYLLIKPILKSK